MSRAVMQQAFNAMSYGNTAEREAARIALLGALAQPAQEPLIKLTADFTFDPTQESIADAAKRLAALAHPDPLTNDLITLCVESADAKWSDADVPMVWAWYFANALKAALAQPEQPTIKQSLTVEQEPVATISITQRGSSRTIDNHFADCVKDWPDGEYQLYTSPAQRQPLTSEEIEALIPQPVLRDERGRGFGGEGSWDRAQVRKVARAIEAAA